MGMIISTATATIQNGSSLSGAVCLGEKVLCGVQIPSAWDAASITFQTSIDGGVSWIDLHDESGNEVAVATPSAGEYRALDPAYFAGAMFLKLRSGSSAAPVNQTANRSVALVARKFFPAR